MDGLSDIGTNKYTTASCVFLQMLTKKNNNKKAWKQLLITKIIIIFAIN